MICRIACLSLMASLGLTARAHAHRLIVECHVQPAGRVQVESWFDLTGRAPKGATVQVLRTNGSLVTEGKLDDHGIFLFTASEAAPLKIVVMAGPDHRAEETIAAESLARSLRKGSAGAGIPANGSDPPAPLPLSDRSPRVSAKDILLGIGFLLALAAFVLSVRNARRLRELSQVRETPKNNAS
jgi:hypothetical protein